MIVTGAPNTNVSHDVYFFTELHLNTSCMAFDPQRWIFVGDMDACAHSKKQVEICKDLALNIKGAIFCNDKDHRDSEACVKVPAFPCFCNLDSNICVAGLRDSRIQFEELQKLSDEALKNKGKVRELHNSFV